LRVTPESNLNIGLNPDTFRLTLKFSGSSRDFSMSCGMCPIEKTSVAIRKFVHANVSRSKSEICHHSQVRWPHFQGRYHPVALRKLVRRFTSCWISLWRFGYCSRKNGRRAFLMRHCHLVTAVDLGVLIADGRLYSENDLHGANMAESIFTENRRR